VIDGAVRLPEWPSLRRIVGPMDITPVTSARFGGDGLKSVALTQLLSCPRPCANALCSSALRSRNKA
jgi:hypothetical protein